MKFLSPDKIYEINGVTVKDFFLTEHNQYNIELPKKRKKKLLGITIHNTEAIKQASGTTMSEQYTRATLYGNMADTRVHYYVDDVEAWHNLPDDYINWSCSDGVTGNGNTSTIAIEVIGNSEKAEKNAVKLVAGLMKLHGLTPDCLFTHSYWLNVKMGAVGTREELNVMKNVRKNCPAYILPHWADFENSIAENYNAITGEPSVLYRVQVGAYSHRENAENFLKTVKDAGFENAFITTVKR